jgi:uncharacterized protein YegJ (DUF2314 family)
MGHEEQDDVSPESLADAFRALIELQKQIDETAKSLVDGVRVLVDHRAEYRPVRAADYPDHDAGYYDRTGEELAALSIRTLGDFEDAAFSRANPDKHVFVRWGLSDDGTIGAMWFRVGSGGSLSLHSWLEDGRTITTHRTSHASGVPDHPQALSEPLAPETPAATVAKRHRSRVAAAGSLPRLLAGIDDLLQALAADEKRSAEFREAQGLALFEPMLRAQLGDGYDDQGPELVESIQNHPEWWSGEPGHPGAAESAGDVHAPVMFLASREKDGRGHLTTMGQMFRGYSEMQMKAVAGNHWRAARFLMIVTAHKLIAAAIEPDRLANLELSLTRADVPLPNLFTSWGHFPEVTEDGDARVRLAFEPFGAKRGLLSFFRKDPELLSLLPPDTYQGSQDQWLRQTCRRLGQDAPEPLPADALGDEMQRASRRARETLPEFRERFRRDLEEDQEMVVKVGLTTTEGTPEYVWVKVTAWDEAGVTGTLETPPNHCPGYTEGQEMRVPDKDIFDRAIVSKTQGMIEVALTDIVAQEFGVDL